MVRKMKNPNGVNSVNPAHPVNSVNPETTEPASLRSEMISHIAMFMAIVMSAMGLATITSTAAGAATSTVKIQTADRAAAPGEFTVRSLAATKNETKRLYKINRVAGKKAEVRVVRNKLVAFARKQIGDPYRAGRSGPDAFDCSGLVRYVYKEVTGKTLPHYSKAQYQQVKKIKRKNAQPGDLVFFFQGGAHHVGIYIGKGKMIDAPNTRKNVRVSPITGSWWGRSYTGMGRMLPA